MCLINIGFKFFLDCNLDNKSMSMHDSADCVVVVFGMVMFVSHLQKVVVIIQMCEDTLSQ